MKIQNTHSYTATDLVPIEIVRQHVRALDDSEDALLTLYLESAIDYLAQATNRLLGAGLTTILLDRDEVSEVVRLHGLNNVTTVSVQYRKSDDSYATLDTTEYSVSTDYPTTLDLTEALPSDLSEHDEDRFKVVAVTGAALANLPKQYRQAALLLVGHYYNQREAEVIGQITSELKEGVQRLITSIKQY